MRKLALCLILTASFILCSCVKDEKLGTVSKYKKITGNIHPGFMIVKIEREKSLEFGHFFKCFITLSLSKDSQASTDSYSVGKIRIIPLPRKANYSLNKPIKTVTGKRVFGQERIPSKIGEVKGWLSIPKIGGLTVDYNIDFEILKNGLKHGVFRKFVPIDFFTKLARPNYPKSSKATQRLLDRYSKLSKEISKLPSTLLGEKRRKRIGVLKHRIVVQGK